MLTLATIFTRFSFLAPLVVMAWGSGTFVRAQSPEDSFTLQLPVQENLATPAWLGHPVEPAGSFASLELPLTAPAADDSLLVTIVFQEKEGGFLRISWTDADGEAVLSNNFYEGVGMANQRTLLIPASVVKSTGTLSLQCGDTTLDVQQIHLEWVEGHPALVSPETSDEMVIPHSGTAVAESLLDGQPENLPTAQLNGSVVTVPLTTEPERIEKGVEFSLQLSGTPKAARLAFDEAGLPWGEHYVVWINQQRAGTITPAVPDLQDVGLASPPDATKPYVGWRSASFYLPVALMKPGVNALQLSVEEDVPAADGSTGDDTTASQPLAVNHLICEFDYTVTGGVAASAGGSSPAAESAPGSATTGASSADEPRMSSSLSLRDAEPEAGSASSSAASLTTSPLETPGATAANSGVTETPAPAPALAPTPTAPLPPDPNYSLP